MRSSPSSANEVGVKRRIDPFCGLTSSGAEDVSHHERLGFFRDRSMDLRMAGTMAADPDHPEAGVGDLPGIGYRLRPGDR